MNNKTANITLLDCTLRDGGYVNNWMFGYKNIQEIVSLLGLSNVEYIEVGFIRLGDYNKDQVLFDQMNQLSELIYSTNKKISVIVEIGYGYPVAAFPVKSDNTADLIRVIMWKRHQKECFEYCTELIEKGYKVCVQLTRTDQYTADEFATLIRNFNQLKLYGLYIVDTFGLLTKDMLLGYFNIANDLLNTDIAIGYHSHNNLQQAFSNAISLAEVACKHELMIDASILGMGRGAGNLQLELFMKYLNEKHNKNYDLTPVLQAADDYIIPIYKEIPWGYSMPYYLSAVNNVNPSYVNYIENRGFTIQQIDRLFKRLNQEGFNIVYDEIAINNIIDNEII